MSRRVQKSAKAEPKTKRSKVEPLAADQDDNPPERTEEIETNSGTSQDERVCILILGMHRSGTSALTRIISFLGAKLPRRIIGAGIGNELGHWEPSRLVEYHDQFLAELGSKWHDWRSLDLQSLPVSRRETMQQDIREILKEDYKGAPVIVVKDPRICRFANFFHQALLEEGYRMHVVLPFRNPLDVVDSLMARKAVWPEELGFVDAALLWLSHNLDAAHFASTQTTTVLSFETLAKDWKPKISSLIQEIGDPSILDLEAVEQDVEAFFDTGLRTHKRRSEDLLLDGRISGWTLDTFSALQDLEAERNVSAAYLKLERIRTEFRDALPLLETMADERRAALAEVADINERLGVTQAELSQVNAIALDREAALAVAGEEMSVVNADLRTKDEELSVVNADLRTKEEELSVVNADFRTKEEELSVVNADLRTKEEELSAANADLRAKEEELSQARAAVRQLESDVVDQRTAATRAVVHLKDQYEKSTSWRLTSPLRRLATGPLVRGVKGLRKNKAATALSNLFNRPNKASHLIVNEFADRRPEVVGSPWHIASYRSQIGDVTDTLPAITVSAVTYNSSKWIRAFIESLAKQNYPINKITLHVVDNGSTDDTLTLLSEMKAEIGGGFGEFLVSSRPNNGYGMGNDFAIRQSKDEYVLVSNVDLKFTATALTSVVSFACRDEETVGSWELRQQPYEHPKYYDPVTLETAWSSHACILFRRSSYLQVEGYEPQIFMYGEDVELSYRLRSFGFVLRYVPWATVTHHVDLEDTSVRPHQLSGSLSANVLLRTRYGSRLESLAGRNALKGIAAKEADPNRLAGMRSAIEAVGQKRKHFRRRKQSGSQQRHFPFTGFDYHLSRPGHDWRVQTYTSGEPAPLVTVITRTYGPKLRYLREAIGSVLNQTYPNIEHIIVEDRTEYAEELVEEIKADYGANIRYLHSTKGGRSPAGNLALSRAKGEYIMMLDNDDLLFADHVEQLVRALQAAKRDEVAAYSLGWEVVTQANGSDTYEEMYHNLPQAHTEPYCKDRLSVANYIPIQSILFHRNLYDEHGGFDEELEHLEDWNLWVRFSQSGDFVYVPKLTSMYRTPADPNIRQERQKLLDNAYAVTVEKNAKHKVET